MPKEYYLYVNGQRVKVSEQIYNVPDFMSCHATDFFACR